jgi:hypothetical protein
MQPCIISDAFTFMLLKRNPISKIDNSVKNTSHNIILIEKKLSPQLQGFSLKHRNPQSLTANILSTEVNIPVSQQDHVPLLTFSSSRS